MRKTRVFAALLCLMMIATVIPMMQASADIVTKTEAELLDGYMPWETEDFSESVGKAYYYEYYKTSRAITGNKTYWELTNDGLASLAGTSEVVGGQLKMATLAKRENVEADGLGNAFESYDTEDASTVTATAYPSLKYQLNNIYAATPGKKLSFKLKFDAIGGDQNGHLLQMEIYNGLYRICPILTPTGIAIRNTDKYSTLIPAVHEAGTTYEYLMEVEEGETDAITDDYIELWRRTSDSEPFTYLGRAIGTTFSANANKNISFWCRTSTTLYVDDIVLYDVDPAAGTSPYSTIDFSSHVGTTSYYEYYRLSEKVNGEGNLYQQLYSGFTDAATNIGTSAIDDGKLVLTAKEKRENQTATESGTAFGKGADGETDVTATAYPSMRYNLTNYINWQAGQKVSFKLNFDVLGADNNGDVAEVEFMNGVHRIAMCFTKNSIRVRNTDQNSPGISFPGGFQEDTNYQFLVDYQDNYIDLYYRVDGTGNYNYLGRASNLPANSNKSTWLYARTATRMLVDEIVLYDTNVNDILASKDVLKKVTFPSTAAIGGFGSYSDDAANENVTPTVANNLLKLVGPSYDSGDKYVSYNMSPLVLNDGDFLCIKGTPSVNESRNGSSGVYFEFDIINYVTDTSATRLRFVAQNSGLALCNESFTAANDASHALNNSYEYLIQRDGAGADASYKLWRRVNNDTNWTWIGSKVGQTLSQKKTSTAIIKTRNQAGFDVTSVTHYGTLAESETSKKQATLTAGLTPLKTSDFSGTLADAGYVRYYIDYAKTGTNTYANKSASTSTVAQGTASVEGGMLKLVTNDKTVGVDKDVNDKDLGQTCDAYPATLLQLKNTADLRVGDKFSFKVKVDQFGTPYNGAGDPAAGEIRFHTGAVRIYPRFYPNKLGFRGVTSLTGGFNSCAHIAGITYEYLFEYAGGADASIVTDNTIKVWRRIDGETNYTYIGSGLIEKSDYKEANTTIAANTNTIMYIDDIVLYGTQKDTTMNLTATDVSISRLSVPAASNTVGGEQGVLCLASYTGGATPVLLDVKTISITEAENTIITIASTGLNTEGASEIRAFLWKGLSNVMPVLESQSVALGE